MAIEVQVDNDYASAVKERLSVLSPHKPVCIPREESGDELLVYSSFFTNQQSFAKSASALPGVREVVVR